MKRPTCTDRDKLVFEASEYSLRDLLVNQKINELPQSLNWFIDEVIDTFLRKETSAAIAFDLVCHGPKKYKKTFLEKFFAKNPESFELALAVISCDNEYYKEVFLIELLKYPQLRKQDLLDVLVFIDKFPKLYD